MRKTWKTREYKDCLWEYEIATTVQKNQNYMTKLSQFEGEAFEWLKKIPSQHWARSHFLGIHIIKPHQIFFY